MPILESPMRCAGTFSVWKSTCGLTTCTAPRIEAWEHHGLSRWIALIRPACTGPYQLNVCNHIHTGVRVIHGYAEDLFWWESNSDLLIIDIDSINQTT